MIRNFYPSKLSVYLRTYCILEYLPHTSKRVVPLNLSALDRVFVFDVISPYLSSSRNSGGPPEAQFTQWVDAVIFVFSLENESSFQMVYSYYAQMARSRNMAEIPLILVGTQDAISETSPRYVLGCIVVV